MSVCLNVTKIDFASFIQIGAYEFLNDMHHDFFPETVIAIFWSEYFIIWVQIRQGSNPRWVMFNEEL